jgi:alpha-L-rhamnosidase
MNLFVGFRTAVEAPADRQVILRLTGSSLYRFYVNGQFVGHGPARAAHDYYRVGQWDITEHLQPGSNVIAIESAGYNVDSYYLLNVPAFLQAEVSAGDKVLAATGTEGADFEAFILPEKLQKVQRYSSQRTFTEVYRLQNNFARWRNEPSVEMETVKCEVLSERKLLPRRIPNARFTKRPPVRLLSSGTFKTGRSLENKEKAMGVLHYGLSRGGYPVEELAAKPALTIQKTAIDEQKEIDQPMDATTELSLPEKAFHIMDLGTNLSGFVGMTLQCEQPVKLFVVFDEILTGKDVDFKRAGWINLVSYELQPGTYQLETFEPYTLRYLKLMAVEGKCRVSNIYLREFANPDVWEADFACSDPRLNKIFEAGRETYRQNATDIFMDCPSRERAGWLCDSYFTARVAPRLAGHNLIEKNFLENYLLYEKMDELPAGMLPMCYPADHRPNSFIPNWAMWFVTELREYQSRSGDHEMVRALEPKVMKLLEYFDKFKNEDGLLEGLESWVFIEWSAANSFVQDVNYPSNMLYAQVLEDAGQMYDKPELVEQAETVRQTVRDQSFDGQFFVDNAVRKDGELKVTNNRTETCQYYAFYSRTATPEKYPELWKKMADEFGPKRKQTKKYPEIHGANMLNGIMLRLDLLSRNGLVRKAARELIDYNLYMAERTGTLWENVGDYASCNHGFASHAVNVLYRDVLGLYKVDPVNKMIHLRFGPQDISFCRGTMPTPDGLCTLSWQKDDKGVFVYKLDPPAGYKVRVECLDGVECRSAR